MAIVKWDNDETGMVIETTSSNKKVKNAKKVFFDEIWFRSKLEYYVYRRLKELNIKFEYEKMRFTLIFPFEFQGEKIRAMTYKPDFVGETFVIEIKGHKTDAWKVREKLVKRRFAKDFQQYKFYQISSMNGFEEIVKDLLSREKNIKKLSA